MRATTIASGTRSRSMRRLSWKKKSKGKLFAVSPDAIVLENISESSDWSTFEMGKSPVYWEPTPTAGETFTIYFNPKANGILNAESSIAFNGGFNGPFMCGGVPRLMSKRDRGPACDPLYSIRLNVPKHAVWLEFSFTDGTSWDEGYKLRFLVPESFRGQNLDFFNKELRREMSEEDACYQAIFPDPVPEPDSHFLGGSMSIGMSCDLDVVSGCTDPDSPNYDPLATIDDATCEEDF